jgi:hypothetical protein
MFKHFSKLRTLVDCLDCELLLRLLVVVSVGRDKTGLLLKERLLLGLALLADLSELVHLLILLLIRALG